jgi:hypothetical protein
MKRMRRNLFFLIIVILVSGACKRLTHKDHSLTVKEYCKLGMPDPGKPWSLKNYYNSHITLGTLKIYNPESLPRKYSRKSSAVFSSIVNKNILSLFDDPKLQFTAQAMEIQQFARLQNELIGMYGYMEDSSKYYNEELPDIYIFTLCVQDKKLELARKIMNSKELRDINFQSGLPSVVNNYLRVLKIMLTEQVKSKVYPIKELENISAEISRSLMQNNEFFTPDDRQILKSEIQNIIDNAPSEIIKNNYVKTLKAINPV